MVSPSVAKVLERAMYYVVSAYGGAPNLIGHLERLGQAEERTYKILSHFGGVHVITPWEANLQLYEGDAFLGYKPDQSIVLDLPYSVYDWQGHLLYRVSNHQGWFGYSPLDKVLILQSDIGDMYYLTYPTYGEVVVKLLLVNNLSYRQTTVLNNKALVAPKDTPEEAGLFEVPSENTITFKLKTLRKPSRLDIYHLKSVPTHIPEWQVIKDSPNRTLEQHPIEVWDEKVLWFPKDSGWVYLEVNGTPISIGRPYGDGVDRFTQATAFVWYVAVGRELNSLMHQAGTKRVPPNFSREGIIKLEMEI